jgi:glyoxylase-like metal-dependent hydrolase (beta-lactamase superfamily II)
MTTTRRTIVAAASGAAAYAMAPGAQAQTAQPAASPPTPATGGQAPGFYRYKVGEIEATAINDGFAMRPIEGFVRNAETAQVSKALENAFLPPTGLPIPFTTTVLRTGGRLILIDTGNGDAGAPTTGTWMANFKAAGFDPAQVNTVIISHFHPDHINGLRLKNGTAVFPNAEVMVPAPEWAYWMDEGKIGGAPEGIKANAQNVKRVFGPIAKDVKPYEAGKEIAPGITVVAAPGHTPGHVAYVVSSGTGKLMLMSDITNHPALFARNPDWQAVFDMDGNQAVETRKKLLDMAAAERVRVAFYHAPFPATGFVAKSGTGYEFVPAQWSSAT